MPTDAQRIQAVFLAAAEIADPAERAAFLDGACDGDAELRTRVEALLRAHDQPDSLLDHPAVAPHDPDPGDTRTFAHEGRRDRRDEVPLGFLARPPGPTRSAGSGTTRCSRCSARAGSGSSSGRSTTSSSGSSR